MNKNTRSLYEYVNEFFNSNSNTLSEICECEEPTSLMYNIVRSFLDDLSINPSFNQSLIICFTKNKQIQDETIRYNNLINNSPTINDYVVQTWKLISEKLSVFLKRLHVYICFALLDHNYIFIGGHIKDNILNQVNDNELDIDHDVILE